MLNEINCEIEDDICIFQVFEETVPIDSTEFVNQLRELFKENPVKGYILAFAGVSFLSSMTIGFLFLLMREFGKPATPFVITEVNDLLAKVINMVGMTKMCKSFSTKAEAMQYFVQRAKEAEAAAAPKPAPKPPPATKPSQPVPTPDKGKSNDILQSIQSDLQKLFEE